MCPLPLVKLVITADRMDVTVITDLDVVLSFAEINGAKPPIMQGDITWQFTSTIDSTTFTITEEIDTRYSFSQDLLSLTISNVKISDEGIYQLAVEHPAGGDSDFIQLIVSGERVIDAC